MQVQPGRPDEAGYEPVSSTLWRQREEYCARLIQHAWRKHKQHRDGGGVSSDEGPDGGPDGGGAGTGAEDGAEDGDESSTGGGRQTAVLVESDGFVTKNGHRVVIHSRSPSVSSRLADV